MIILKVIDAASKCCIIAVSVEKSTRSLSIPTLKPPTGPKRLNDLIIVLDQSKLHINRSIWEIGCYACGVEGWSPSAAFCSSLHSASGRRLWEKLSKSFKVEVYDMNTGQIVSDSISDAYTNPSYVLVTEQFDNISILIPTLKLWIKRISLCVDWWFRKVTASHWWRFDSEDM